MLDAVDREAMDAAVAGGPIHRLAGGKADGVKKVGTQEMGDAIVKELERLT